MHHGKRDNIWTPVSWNGGYDRLSLHYITFWMRHYLAQWCFLNKWFLQISHPFYEEEGWKYNTKYYQLKVHNPRKDLDPSTILSYYAWQWSTWKNSQIIREHFDMETYWHLNLSHWNDATHCLMEKIHWIIIKWDPWGTCRSRTISG